MLSPVSGRGQVPRRVDRCLDRVDDIGLVEDAQALSTLLFVRGHAGKGIVGLVGAHDRVEAVLALDGQ